MRKDKNSYPKEIYNNPYIFDEMCRKETWTGKYVEDYYGLLDLRPSLADQARMIHEVWTHGLRNLKNYRIYEKVLMVLLLTILPQIGIMADTPGSMALSINAPLKVLKATSTNISNTRLDSTLLSPYAETLIKAKPSDFYELYSDEIDSCLTDVPILKGFCTDTKGRFYFLGGMPDASIVCYEGDQLVWQRSLDRSLKRNIHAVFRLVGDSLCILDEEVLSIIKLCKDGQGKISSVPLCLSTCDTIIAATPSPDGIEIIAAKRKDVRWSDDRRNLSDTLLGEMIHFNVLWNGIVQRKKKVRDIPFKVLEDLQSTTTTDSGLRVKVINYGDPGNKIMMLKRKTRDERNLYAFYLPNYISWYTSPDEPKFGVTSSANICSFQGDKCFVPGYDDKKGVIVEEYMISW